MPNPRPLTKFLLLIALLPACTAGMKLKMDAAWESLDPMGHRKIHQERDFPRTYKTGIKLPEDESEYPLPGSRW